MKYFLLIILIFQLFVLGYILYAATDWIRHLSPRQMLYECYKRGLITYEEYSNYMKEEFK